MGKELENKTPDIIIAFATWLDKARGSSRYLFFNKRRALFDFALQQLGEGGALHFLFNTQTESISFSNEEAPASQRHRIAWVKEELCPIGRPYANVFVTKSSSYELEGTDEVRSCHRCHGSGRVNCSSCWGSGRCSSCSGSGRKSVLRDGVQKSEDCSACNGGRCRGCSGTGKVQCGTCDGEGQLVHWLRKHFQWKHHIDPETILPESVDRRDVKSLVKKNFEKDMGLPLQNFDADEINEKTGIYNDRIEDLVVVARGREAEVDAEIRHRDGVILFQTLARSFAFLGFLNLKVGSGNSSFFVTGNQACVSVVPPKVPLSWSKTGFLAVALSSLVALLFSLNQPQNLELLLPLSACLLVPSGALALINLIGDGRLKNPPRWVIFDENDLLGWYFTYVYGQMLATTRSGYIRDPAIIRLMEQPHQEKAKRRNSFSCTLAENQSGSARTWELINISHYAQLNFPQETAALVPSCSRLTWIFDDSDYNALDDKICKAIQAVPEVRRAELQIWIIREGPLMVAEPLPLEQTTQLVSPDQLTFLDLPMVQMFTESRGGQLSEASRNAFSALENLKPW